MQIGSESPPCANNRVLYLEVLTFLCISWMLHAGTGAEKIAVRDSPLQHVFSCFITALQAKIADAATEQNMERGGGGGGGGSWP